MNSKLITLFLFCSITWIHAHSADADGPNFVVIMVDDMGYAGPSIEPYENPHYKTPGMDRLAREGMRFTDFHSSGTVCSPTRAGLVTGRYQQRSGIEAVIHPSPYHPEHRKGLMENEITFAELLKAAGYATGVVGKWHLGYPKNSDRFHPDNHGFDYFRGYHSGNIDYQNHWGDHYAHDWWHGRVEVEEAGYSTHLISQYALEFIEEQKDNRFCLYVAHEAPHDPIQGPDDPIQRGPGAKPLITDSDRAMKEMMLEMDKSVSEIRDKLVELGLAENTLILFFSDNGDAPSTNTGSERYRGRKGSVYEGGHRVPLIAWWPSKIAPDKVCEQLAISLDVMPTLLSLAGVEMPRERKLDGVDLSPALFGKGKLEERPLFWANMSNRGQRTEAMREGPWKLVVKHPEAGEGTFENPVFELYNLERDPSESMDLSGSETERTASMAAALNEWLDEVYSDATPQPGGWVETGMRSEDSEAKFKQFLEERKQLYEQ